jgi:hypothetical protein
VPKEANLIKQKYMTQETAATQNIQNQVQHWKWEDRRTPEQTSAWIILLDLDRPSVDKEMSLA